MTQLGHADWPYPGSRWWKFDFHTHTPVSQDTHPWQKAIGSPEEVTPKKWLLKYMAVGIDCVAVTDHNSGGWIDPLKEAYLQMKGEADQGSPPDGFRELTLFPGVEISVSGGFHLLAIFDPSADAVTIENLRGAVGYEGTPGDSDDVTKKGPVEVVQAVLDAGAIPIPAHADGAKGLLRVEPGTQRGEFDANTVRQVMEIEDLLAVEWLNPSLPMPAHVEKRAAKLARVLGSDCHNFRDDAAPGARFTWIKMASPTLEGLRLALLDGNGVSVRRSDEDKDDQAFDPYAAPSHFLTAVEIDSARYMGNGTVERLAFTPYANALIGGRGTGKSTIVHALRLACRRDQELRSLDEPKRQFSSFAMTGKVRSGEGGLRDGTEIRVEMMREGRLHRLRWRQDGQGEVVEERANGTDWLPSGSQTVSPGRFPIRIFSQGQIAAMAGENRQALLAVIDQAAGVGDLDRDFAEAKDRYFTQCAELRELDTRLKNRDELERKREDLRRKIETLSQLGHAEILRAHQQGLRQRREVDGAFEQLQAMPQRIESLQKDLLLDDWPAGVFDAQRDEGALAWRSQAERALQEARDGLAKIRSALAEGLVALRNEPGLQLWRIGVEGAKADYESLQGSLAEQGVGDPQAFGRLVQERQQIESKLKRLDEVRRKRDALHVENAEQYQQVSRARGKITEKRVAFLTETLAANEFVRIEAVRFGFDARNIERSLRQILKVPDERFEGDILRMKDGEPTGGLAAKLAAVSDGERAALVEDVKKRLIETHSGFGGRFSNYLKRESEQPEFLDRIRCWFPDDDLRIQYSRSGDGSDWSAIEQGSQGQRSAALLAFLLSFGDEPLILDQPEDDLDNHLIYDLIVRQIRENKRRRQLIIATHNPNVVVNGDAEMVHAFDFKGGQCRVFKKGALQDGEMREEVCRVMEGGREAFSRRWARLGREVGNV